MQADTETRWVESIKDIEPGKKYEIVRVAVSLDYHTEGLGEVITADSATILVDDETLGAQILRSDLWDGDEDELRQVFEELLLDGDGQWELTGIREVAEERADG